ncbi:hypothetical protein K505DRAFT_294350 [Melanomma pulvis-pyrius CBS 109.77]|uniref:Uncharacterized protein n=1 Tax=Melanomma pulvis-pyrius CBS 109.77 TaxID=1314802 RepID=A0A6A6XSK1_9PLEO|nr:hypothetical protein K505DRAFT_294350 [Melanomma pulvis-pyrius CBS 109.77]
MKTDNYLTLCLEQASKSPLRYRHGCIIVRGGKVIGQGYNDYRAGFNGGALKTGRLPASSQDGSAIAALKKKHKLKREPKNERECKSDSQEVTTKTFTPFENMSGMGGGKHANTPLSMHSEMMAIHSAISASSTLASIAVSSQKPYFKLSGDSKRRARLHREAIKAYVEIVCTATLDQSATEQRNAPQQVQHREVCEQDVVLPKENSIEKHRRKNQEIHHHNRTYPYHSGQQRRQSAHKSPAHETITGPCHSKTGSSLFNNEHRLDLASSPRGTDQASKHYSSKTHHSNPSVAKTQPMLIPKGRTGQNSHSVTERMKHPRLHGADLYVARLGWRSTSASDDSNTCCDTSAVIEAESPDNRSGPHTGSLHDELSTPPSMPKSANDLQTSHAKTQPTVLASRPCYRCISYMNSVGIKRVFWTTDSGVWEGAKVRDLVEALDTLGNGKTSDVNTALNSVFVTKHEVLMLRRIMGDS